MNRFQKYCMRQAKKMMAQQDNAFPYFCPNDLTVQDLYKAHKSLYSKANLDRLLRLEKVNM